MWCGLLALTRERQTGGQLKPSLVSVLNVTQVKSLLKLRFIHDIEIEAFIQVSMNPSRGIASHSHFVDISETEITDCMADQAVIEARKTIKNVDSTRRSTASVILTFSAAKLPDRVHVGY